MQQEALNTHIGRTIAQWRKQGGFSQEILAEQMGYDVPTLQAIESGGAISAADLYRLSLFFQTSPASFFTGLEGFSQPSESDAAYDAETSELMQNFLQIDEPNRGQLFSDFMTQFGEKSKP